MPGLREVTAEEFLLVNKGLILAFHRNFVCGVPYGQDIMADLDQTGVAFLNDNIIENYSFVTIHGSGAAIIEQLGGSSIRVSNEGVEIQGNFYDVKLFEVVE